jgi:RNA polymerase sigma-70 factor (ECF subfamily)
VAPDVPALQAAHARARAAWPGVEVELAEFAAWVTERGTDEASLEGLHTDDLYLACACARSDRAALRLFEARFGPRAEAAARGLDGDRDFASEVAQRVRTRLFTPRSDGGAPRITEYRGRGPLAAWVGVTATRLGLTLLREQKRAGRYDDERWAAALVAPITGDLEIDYLKEAHRGDLQRALEGACVDLPARERTVLRLAFVEGLTIDDIGGMYGVHRATAARWIQRGRAALMDLTRARLVQILNVSPEELSSFDRLLRSQLEVSLHGLFGEDEAAAEAGPDDGG